MATWCFVFYSPSFPLMLDQPWGSSLTRKLPPRLFNLTGMKPVLITDTKTKHPPLSSSSSWREEEEEEMLGCSPRTVTRMFVSDGSLCIHTAQVNKRTLTNTIYDWMSRMTSEIQTLGWSFLPAQLRARLCARSCLLVENKTSEVMDKAGSFKSQLRS